MSPLVKWTLGVLGTAGVVHWVVKEVRRINGELERVRASRVEEVEPREVLKRLKRDPATGIYRPE